MTSTQGSWDADFEARAADSAECLVVVGGYSEYRLDLDQAVRAARLRLLMSPSLADFFELRLVDMGLRPAGVGGNADDAAEVVRLGFELTSRPGEVARNFSALLIIDPSARVVDRLLRECRANSVLSDLNVRFRGIARNDDRSRVTHGVAPGSGTRTVISLDGERLSSDPLDAEIARYAEDLLADFGSGAEQGLPPRKLDQVGAEAESRLRSVVEAESAATLERRRAELKQEAVRRDADLRRETERKRAAARQDAELRELKRDAERRDADPAAARETERVDQQEDIRPPKAARDAQPAARGSAQTPTNEAYRGASWPEASGADNAESDAEMLLLGCAALIQARNKKGLQATLSRLRAYASVRISDEERQRLRLIMIKDRLLLPGLHLDDLEVRFYDVMLRLAYGLPLSYPAYCDIEDVLSVPGKSVRYPQFPLLEAISGGGTADIRVAAITAYHLGEGWLANWFRSGRIDLGQLIATLDQTWDRPHHADLMYDVSLKFLAVSRGRRTSRAVIAGLHEHGYLAAALLKQYPESDQDQVNVLIGFLRAAYPNGLNRRAVRKIAAVSASTRALRRAVLASLRASADREWAADLFAERLGAEDINRG